MLIGHPCASRGRSGKLNEAQTVVEVRPAAKATSPERPFEAPWDSHYALYPLPDLKGEDYVADFDIIGVTNSGFLAGKRIACLNKPAWAALQRRYIHHFGRLDLLQEDVERRLEAFWAEIELWEKWTTHQGTEDGFQAWLDEPLQQGHYAGSARRELLAFASDEVEAELQAHLGVAVDAASEQSGGSPGAG
jgi:hypothetical protein